MSESPSSLRQFGVETHTPATTAVASSATIVEPPEDRDLGPFEEADTEYGIQTQIPTKRQSLSGSGPSAEQYHVRWVVGGGIEGYVDEYSQGDVWTVPSTYDEFDHIEPMVGRVDSTAPGKNAYGWGIDGLALERAFRVLTGGGRYNASQYKVIPCGVKPWILTGPEGTVLATPTTVDQPNHDFEQATTTVETAGMSLEAEEENERILLGIKRFGSLLAEREIYLSSHTCPAEATYGKHRFEDAEGSVYRVSTETLLTLANLRADPTNVQGTGKRGLTAPDGRMVMIEDGWEGPDHEVRDVIDGKVLAGWRFEWDDPDYSPETVATVATYWLKNTRSSTYGLERRVDRLRSTC